MDKQLKTLVGPDVEAGIFEGSPRLTVFETTIPQLNGLFIELLEVGGEHIAHPLNAWGHHIWNRHAVAVFFDVDGRQQEQCAIFIDGCKFTRRLKRPKKATPVGAHHLKGCHTAKYTVLEAIEVHTHETDRFKVDHIAYPPVRGLNRHPKLVPLHPGRGAVAQLHIRLINVADVIAPDFHITGPQADLVFEIVFRLGEGVVEVDVLCVGKIRSRCGIRFR